MPEFVVGLFLIAVGFTGNAGGLLEELAGDGNFVAFALALGVFYFAWEETPPPEQKPVRLLLVGVAIAILLTQASRIISALTTAWQAITSLQGGKIANDNVSPAASGTSGLGGLFGGVGSLLTGAGNLGNAFGGSGSLFGGSGTYTGGASGGFSGGTGGITDPGTLTQQLLLDQNTESDATGSNTSGVDFSITNTMTPVITDLSPAASYIGTEGFGNLSAAQIQAESSGQQFTASGDPLISSAGAVGISQILPSTAQQVAASLGIPFSLSDLETDPSYNAELGSAYMGQLLQQFGGNQAAALAAYNAGPNNAGVIQFYQSGNASALPAATQSYLQKILGPNWNATGG